MAGPFLSLLTDFGERDPSAAILHGVILGIVPDARIVDISHEVEKYAIRDGALLLWCALPYLPVGTHLAVVDPGVGTARRPVAILTGRGDVLVGPDNGLLMAGADRLGGAVAAHLLQSETHRLPVISTSFHGRDIFAPAAAHLAAGVPLADLGEWLDPARLVPSPIPDPLVEPGLLRSVVVYVDTFGNVKLAGLRPDLEAALGPLTAGDPLVVTLDGVGSPDGRAEPIELTWQGVFGEVGTGASLLYEDSYGRLCLAENQGNLARRLGLAEDRPLTIARP